MRNKTQDCRYERERENHWKPLEDASGDLLKQKHHSKDALLLVVIISAKPHPDSQNARGPKNGHKHLLTSCNHWSPILPSLAKPKSGQFLCSFGEILFCILTKV